MQNHEFKKDQSLGKGGSLNKPQKQNYENKKDIRLKGVDNKVIPKTEYDSENKCFSLDN